MTIKRGVDYAPVVGAFLFSNGNHTRAELSRLLWYNRSSDVDALWTPTCASIEYKRTKVVRNKEIAMLHSTRRTFLRAGLGALASSPILSALVAQGLFAKEPPRELIWGMLLHLGRNMWGDTPRAYTPPVDKFSCEEDLWKLVTEKVAESGLNMIVIDLGEAILYKSHPEIALPGAWTPEKLREDLARLRDLGLEPIPKLNFSACHDHWLGEYSRMVSTPTYYQVCADLIQEVSALFDKPRFFHLGLDEETYNHQKTYDYVVVRQNELWKHDFLFYVEQCEKSGVRPWIWADYAWSHPDFIEWAPKNVVMSNWYYDMEFNPEECRYVQTYFDYDKAGFDQIPAGSNWANEGNFEALVEYCKANLNHDRLLGFLQTSWSFPEKKGYKHNLQAIERAKAAKDKY
ncbi:MAG: Tat pathway signal protein [Planctomycetia bacterium]|nr:Tat pathway signal protein [Planctomycetia bacterium]